MWTATTFVSTYSAHSRHQKLAQNGGCRTIEGPVENFVPMPYSGHAMESFSVHGVRFEYSDYVVADGFNNTASHGGPINKNSIVRICYDPSGNQILRLEIKKFTSQIKDYSKSEVLFPRPDDFKKIGGENPIGEMPWYFNLFIVVYILDFVALISMFIPYLNTCLPVKKSEVVELKVRSEITRNMKVKLRNTILFWDDANRSIWLRPRGINLLQVQLVSARLTTDDEGVSLVAKEIRFSSGFPIAMILFFWAAYHFFGLTMPTGTQGPTPGQFVGFAALFFIVVGVVNVRIMVARMEKLLQDALQEISS